MIRFMQVSLKLGDRQIFDRYNLTVKKGEKVVLSAPSGGGKTSLLKLIQGFIDPDQGEITVHKTSVKPGNMQFIRSLTGYLSQDIDFPNGRVSDVFQEILGYSTNRHIPFSAERLLTMILGAGLPEDILRKNTVDISGGDRQRLGWVFIMLLDRPILLLDEPTSALDEQQKLFFIDYVLKTGKTVICASHDQEWQVPGVTVIPHF